MKDQLQTIREAVNELHNSFPEKERALTAVAQLEAMVGEPEPVACAKCHGTGYYDEGHECDDGTMAGGNYVLCNKCAAPIAQQPQAEPDMRKVCEVLGFDPTNHHNAAKCPYCRGQQPQAEAVPPDVVRDAGVEAAAKKMAEIFDYPWDFMPEKGRNTMRENVRAVLGAAIAQQKGQS